MIIDIILIALLAFGIIRGMKKGLVGVLLGFACLIISIALAFFLRSPIANALMSTKIADNINNTVSQKLVESMDTYNEGEIQKGDFYSQIKKSIINGESIDVVSRNVTNFILNIISFLIIFVISMILCNVLKFVLNIVFDLPILHSINKVGGGVLGIVSVLLKIMIVFTILSLLSPIEFMRPIDEGIKDSNIAKYLYQNNIILNVIKGDFN